MKKALPYIFLIGLVIVALIVKRFRSIDEPPTKKTSTRSSTSNRADNKSTTVDRDRGFDRRVSYIEYTTHAKCRMKCRKITQEEVKDIMQNGEINYNKSDLNDRPCPSYALEGYTEKDNQHVRIVFGQCNEKTKVITCIDLDNDFECHCPGDEKK